MSRFFIPAESNAQYIFLPANSDRIFHSSLQTLMQSYSLQVSGTQKSNNLPTARYCTFVTFFLERFFDICYCELADHNFRLLNNLRFDETVKIFDQIWSEGLLGVFETPSIFGGLKNDCSTFVKFLIKCIPKKSLSNSRPRNAQVSGEILGLSERQKTSFDNNYFYVRRNSLVINYFFFLFSSRDVYSVKYEKMRTDDRDGREGIWKWHLHYSNGVHSTV